MAVWDLSGEIVVADRNGLKAQSAVVDLQLINSVVKGKHISPVDLHAELQDSLISLQARCDDTLAAFTLDATLTTPPTAFTLPPSGQAYYTADLQLATLQPQAFGLVNKGLDRVSTHLTASLSGNTLDSISGNIRARSTKLALQKGIANIGDISLDVNGEGAHKRIRI